MYKLLLARLRENAKGFTLVEVLAGIVIVSIVGTALLAYFSNAYMYTKANQNKTVAVNLARYSLVYFEQQDFTSAKEWLTLKDVGGNYLHKEIRIDDFKNGNEFKDESEISIILRTLFPDNTTAELILAPIVNGVTYEVVIALDEDRLHEFQPGGGKEELADLLLPIKVEVVDRSKQNRNHSKVEGYITHESIR